MTNVKHQSLSALRNAAMNLQNQWLQILANIFGSVRIVVILLKLQKMTVASFAVMEMSRVRRFKNLKGVIK